MSAATSSDHSDSTIMSNKYLSKLKEMPAKPQLQKMLNPRRHPLLKFNLILMCALGLHMLSDRWLVFNEGHWFSPMSFATYWKLGTVLGVVSLAETACACGGIEELKKAGRQLQERLVKTKETKPDETPASASASGADLKEEEDEVHQLIAETTPSPKKKAKRGGAKRRNAKHASEEEHA